MNLQDFKDSINKFSFAQMVSNSDGKTSSSATMGCLIVSTGCLSFLIGIINKTLVNQSVDIMMYSTGIITIGAGLLGYRKSKSKKT